MNKGINLATGEIIGILNADDFYASADALAHVTKVFADPLVDACYGDLLYVAETQSPPTNQWTWGQASKMSS